MKNSIRRSAFDLYFRPLAKNVWITMGTISVTIIVFLLTLFYLRKYFPGLNTTWNKTNRIIVFIAWACFLLIEVHFEGTLIMFLTTEIEIPFHSIRQVMGEYPEWRLLSFFPIIRDRMLNENTKIFFFKSNHIEICSIQTYRP